MINCTRFIAEILREQVISNNGAGRANKCIAREKLLAATRQMRRLRQQRNKDNSTRYERDRDREDRRRYSMFCLCLQRLI